MRSGSNIVSYQVFGQSILVVNTAEAAFDLLDKRSANYSDRTPTPIIDLCVLRCSLPKSNVNPHHMSVASGGRGTSRCKDMARSGGGTVVSFGSTSTRACSPSTTTPRTVSPSSSSRGSWTTPRASNDTRTSEHPAALAPLLRSKVGLTALNTPAAPSQALYCARCTE